MCKDIAGTKEPKRKDLNVIMIGVRVGYIFAVVGGLK